MNMELCHKLFRTAIEEQENQKQEQKKIRINKVGGGRDEKISKEEQIIMTLVYLRHHLNFQLLALMFKVSESTANNVFHKWQKLLELALPSSLREQVKKFEDSLEEIKKILTNYELIVDTEEQEIERSLDYEEQKKHYSGKKKMQTFKNQVICLPKGEDIVDVVGGELGPKADITIWRENADIFVEHLIRIIKIFKVMGERFRLKKEEYESVFLSVCGLVRLRMGTLIIEHRKTSETGEIIDVLLTHIFSSKLDFS